MTPQELREKLIEKGVATDTEFEFVLNFLLDHLLRKADPSLDHILDDDRAFALGFCVGSVSTYLVLEDAHKKGMN